MGTAMKSIRCVRNLRLGISVVVLSATLSSKLEARDQPLAANAARLIQAMELLGAPFNGEDLACLRRAIDTEDALEIHAALHAHTLFGVSINPELRVKVKRSAADPVLQQSGFTPFLVRVNNNATVTRKVNIGSPQSGPVYSGASKLTLQRQAQEELNANENTDGERRFLSVEMYDSPPMSSELSGHHTEYVIALIYSRESGFREATIQFDIGQGTQDLGFRSEAAVLFSIAPAIPVKIQIRDSNGSRTTARLEFYDERGRVYPPQPRRLAPDFFFQPQIYRADGETVLLPPGEFTLISGRGPEYLRKRQIVQVSAISDRTINVQLERWVNPADHGFFSGDHHIHGAGCSHYDNPTQGVTPQDMFAQVKGEGLNVGCVLTWGPCFDFQRQYFSPVAADISEAHTVLKYDLEISGFGSAALGHVCLLNLSDQTYPGSEGTSTKGWPTWTVPVMRWTKEQGAITGYPHSALRVVPESTASWLMQQIDSNLDQRISAEEASGRLLPQAFADIDADRSGTLTNRELVRSADRVAVQIPNTALPSMDGGGAMEIFVSTAEGVCDFISAMDTPRIAEWNPWYHLMNCGFPLKLSGETDFPCMSSRRVGHGRVYVQLGDVAAVDFTDWCRGIAAGQSYVSDGFAHVLDFRVDDRPPGTEPVRLTEATAVTVSAMVAFAREVPRAVAHGTEEPDAGRAVVGDTVLLHAPRNTDWVVGSDRRVEVVLNGRVVHSADVPSDGRPHRLQFEIPVETSSWIAIRQFPQLHSNPVTVLVADCPVRASRASAVWCAESTQLLWHNRQRFIAAGERSAARTCYERAIARFSKIARECPDDGLTIPELPLDPLLMP